MSFSTVLKYGILSQAIAADSTLWNNLIAYYNIDTTAGTTVYDIKGGQDLTLSSGSFNASGKNNGCWLGAGSGNAMTSGSADNFFNFDHDEAFTFSFWYKPTSGDYINIFGKNNTGSPNVGYYCRGGVLSSGYMYLLYSTTNESYQNFGQITGITTNVWNLITLAYDGSSNTSGIKKYLNGVEFESAGSGAMTGTM